MPDSPVSPLIMLNSRSPVPLHVQLQEGIRKEIDRDTFKPGERLPTVQEFAKSHALSTGTVMRAFTELIRQGVLEARRGAGTFVSKRREACTEILLPDWCSRHETSPGATFTNQLLEGLSSGMGDPTRRFSLSSLHGSPPTVWETLQVCAARGADSLLVYGILPNYYEAIRNIARNINTVIVMGNAGIRDVDMVCTDVTGATRSFLEQRIASGQRQFAYLGYEPLVSKQQETYYTMFTTFEQVMSDAGIVPVMVHQVPHATRQRYEQDMKEASLRIPRGATVLVITPSLANVVDPKGEQFDILSYTESLGTLEMYRDYFSMLYLGIDMATREAARLLIQRMRSGSASPAMVSKLKPRLVERTDTMALSKKA